MEQLAGASGVSRAMISKIERGESSPTAVLLGKLSAALELSVSELLTGARLGGGPEPSPAEPPPADATELDDEPAPAGAPGRRHPAVARPGHRLPAQADLDGRVPGCGHRGHTAPDARVPYPAAAYAFIAQLVWVLSGELTLTDGPVRRVLAAGDTFELGQPRSREFGNETAEECRYIVVVTRKSTA